MIRGARKGGLHAAEFTLEAGPEALAEYCESPATSGLTNRGRRRYSRTLRRLSAPFLSPMRIETNRLAIRPFDECDIDPLASILADREVGRFVGGPRDGERVRNYVRMAIAGYRDLGYSRFAVDLKESGTLIGYCGFRDSRPWDDVDFGWAYAKRYWRRGYATEAARAVLSSAPALGLDRIVCIVDPGNVGSRRVIEKIGTVRRIHQLRRRRRHALRQGYWMRPRT